MFTTKSEEKTLVFRKTIMYKFKFHDCINSSCIWVPGLWKYLGAKGVEWTVLPGLLRESTGHPGHSAAGEAALHSPSLPTVHTRETRTPIAYLL